MPGEYPSTAECIMWEDEANKIECTRKVEHSIAFHIEEKQGTARWYCCAHHWPALEQAVQAARSTV